MSFWKMSSISNWKYWNKSVSVNLQSNKWGVKLNACPIKIQMFSLCTICLIWSRKMWDNHLQTGTFSSSVYCLNWVWAQKKKRKKKLRFLGDKSANTRLKSCGNTWADHFLLRVNTAILTLVFGMKWVLIKKQLWQKGKWQNGNKYQAKN